MYVVIGKLMKTDLINYMMWYSPAVLKKALKKVLA